MRKVGDDADRRLPYFLHLHAVRRDAAAEAGRLLRVLLLRFSAVSADPGRAVRRRERRIVLHLTIARRLTPPLAVSATGRHTPRPPSRYQRVSAFSSRQRR